MENLIYTEFDKINIDDSFFDSLRNDYPGFNDWFYRKGNEGATAYILIDPTTRSIVGFLYLKEEDHVTDIAPPLSGRILKIGTFKFNPQGTFRGQKFIKKILDIAIQHKYDSIYLTVYKKHSYLIRLFQDYGFYHHGNKNHELVYVRNLNNVNGGILSDYPKVHLSNANKFMLSIYPDYHTRLFPDSKLHTESPNIIEDVSHSNSVHKIYLCAIQGVSNLRNGDILVIYRTKDGKGPAHYRSVVTSICVIEEYKNINEFHSEDQFLGYCSPYSVFSIEELKKFYNNKKYPHIIKFTYNVSLPRRLTKAQLMEIGINPDYWGFSQLADQQFSAILGNSNADKDYFIY